MRFETIQQSGGTATTLPDRNTDVRKRRKILGRYLLKLSRHRRARQHRDRLTGANNGGQTCDTAAGIGDAIFAPGPFQARGRSLIVKRVRVRQGKVKGVPLEGVTSICPDPDKRLTTQNRFLLGAIRHRDNGNVQGLIPEVLKQSGRRGADNFYQDLRMLLRESMQEWR